jgi:hypothetical protein
MGTLVEVGLLGVLVPGLYDVGVDLLRLSVADGDREVLARLNALELGEVDLDLD